MTRLSIGVMSQEKIRERVLTIAPGELISDQLDPKTWLPSMKSLVEVLNDENLTLLRIITELQPASVAAFRNAP